LAGGACLLDSSLSLARFVAEFPVHGLAYPGYKLDGWASEAKAEFRVSAQSARVELVPFPVFDALNAFVAQRRCSHLGPNSIYLPQKAQDDRGLARIILIPPG
jgi:hypothetical protein